MVTNADEGSAPSQFVPNSLTRRPPSQVTANATVVTESRTTNSRGTDAAGGKSYTVSAKSNLAKSPYMPRKPNSDQ